MELQHGPICLCEISPSPCGAHHGVCSWLHCLMRTGSMVDSAGGLPHVLADLWMGFTPCNPLDFHGFGSGLAPPPSDSFTSPTMATTPTTAACQALSQVSSALAPWTVCTRQSVPLTAPSSTAIPWSFPASLPSQSFSSLAALAVSVAVQFTWLFA